MATKKELYDHLAKLTDTNHRLQHDNDAMRSLLMSIYIQTKKVLGIEAAIQAREDEKRRKEKK